jgi:small-conductance mechanosensitive channel
MDTINPVWYWSLGIIFIFPILSLVLTQIGYNLSRKDAQLGKPFNAFKRVILPLTALILLLTKVIGFSQDSLAIKVLETATWILAINTGLDFINRLFFATARKDTWQGNVPQLFLDIFRIALVTFCGAIVLSEVWGVELGGVATALGLGSFVLGLALQETLGNLFLGIAMVYERPFAVGDWIKTGGEEGQVIEINWRAVHIVDMSGKKVVIPHKNIGTGNILNYSKPSRLNQISRKVKFSAQEPPNRIKEAVLEACKNVEGIINDPVPSVKTVAYLDSIIEYEISYYVEDYGICDSVSNEVLTRLWYTIQRNHLILPPHAKGEPTPLDIKYQNLLEKSLSELPKHLPIEVHKTQDLLDGSQYQVFGKNEIIVLQGDLSGNLYILLEGKVQLSAKALNGVDTPFNIIKEGEFFGEISLLSNRTASMTALALTDVKVLTIFKQEVLDMVGNNHKLASRLDEVMQLQKKKLEKKFSQNGAVGIK